MEYRPFGRTGLEVSAVGFGCQEIGGGYGSIEESEFAQAVGRALDLGINCFDTAEAYGSGASEQALGRALGRRRDEAIVVTKFGVGYPDRPNFRDSSRARVRASIDQSLQNLGTDHVDVYLVHWPDRATPFEETMGALDDVVREGKARFVGVSNFTRDEIAACMQTRRVDVAQYGLNMFDRRMQREILPYCEEQGIGFEAYGSLAYGLLSGTLAPDVEFPPDDWRAKAHKWGVMTPLFAHLFGPDAIPANVAAAEEIKGLAARRGRSLPQLALQWTTANPAVSTSLVGCRNVAEVEDNVGALGWAIDDADLAAIDAIFARHGVNTVPDRWIEER
jgi:aryl-alcohol dehydrogenase-like predicted oxidoreductase